MKLDSRIIDGKKPLTCFDAEAAKAFLGKKGYFNNNLSRFCYLKNCNQGCLRNIFVQNEKCFVAISDYPDTDYKYFLPDAWLKPKKPEIKWRPFSLEEFCKTFKVGDVVKLRKKDLQIAECAMFIGHAEYAEVNKPGANHITLGFDHYSLSSFFNNYELFIDGKWQPFGVEE